MNYLNKLIKDKYNGFYNFDDIDNVLQGISNPKYEELEDNPYDDAKVFKMGSCEIFASQLHEKFGYDIYEYKGDNLHYYCTFNYNNITFYIDVRGITIDKNLFFGPYGSGKCRKVSSDEIIIKDELLEVGKEFANYLIEKFEFFYNIKWED